ncbi:MAG: hypothetical protein EA359_13465 [Balneolaceae bacterium]|nr:MAG: hypothetical protein EA359_13465 [Balneolaceae bacterium]
MIFYKTYFTASLFSLAIFWNSVTHCQPLIEQIPFGPLLDRFETIQQNSVSSLEASGDALWMTPGLNAYFENSGEIYVPQNADSIFTGRGRAFSLAVEGPRIVAGLGFTSTAGGENVNAAQGYYQSFDDGMSWNFLPFPLDSRPQAEANCDGNSVGPPCDIEFIYGGNRYIRTRITVPEQSPPFEVDFYKDTILSVNWASGLLRSTDSGISWERLILPPSFENELIPENSYQWFSRTISGETINRYDPRFDNNLLGFGLLIDDKSRVWVGTAAGINISNNALTAPADQIEWRRISFDPENDSGLLSNWIIKIRQQPETDRIWMTNWRADPDNRDDFGLVYTDDGAQTFHRFLDGERINDVGFFGGDIFAAGDNGLFISDDDGRSWRKIDQIRSPNTFIRQNSRYFAIAATENQLWVGTSDGIASTNDGGETWRIIRTDVPLTGGNIYQPNAPNVTTYAYPNPFSPARHSLVRIKFEMRRAGRATFRIFDFAMNPVRTIRVSPVPVDGTYEITWDGTDESGRIVANGTYFYTIDSPSVVANGKILLLD